MPYANNKDADQPVHLHSLISTIAIRCLDSIISLVSLCAISRLVSEAEENSLYVPYINILLWLNKQGHLKKNFSPKLHSNLSPKVFNKGTVMILSFRTDRPGQTGAV